MIRVSNIEPKLYLFLPLTIEMNALDSQAPMRENDAKEPQ
jgi:hypothetical protein